MNVGKSILILVVLVLALVVLSACTGPGVSTPAPVTQVDANSLPYNITVGQTHALLGQPDVLILDVREQHEYDAGHIPGVTLIPSGQVSGRLNEIPKDRPVIVTCRTGNRSSSVARSLRAQGYTNVHNMEGGIVAWQGAGYPVEK